MNTKMRSSLALFGSILTQNVPFFMGKNSPLKLWHFFRIINLFLIIFEKKKERKCLFLTILERFIC
jgi:hypothetical protein